MRTSLAFVFLALFAICANGQTQTIRQTATMTVWETYAGPGRIFICYESGGVEAFDLKSMGSFGSINKENHAENFVRTTEQFNRLVRDGWQFVSRDFTAMGTTLVTRYYFEK